MWHRRRSEELRFHRLVRVAFIGVSLNVFTHQKCIRIFEYSRISLHDMESYVETLINEVKNHRILWDKKDKNYYNRSLVDKEWAKVSKRLNESKEAVKTKWKNLRDTFRKELKKIPNFPENFKAENKWDRMEFKYTGTWPHFDIMKFLLTVVSLRPGDESVSFLESPVLPSDYVNTKMGDDFPYEEETATSIGTTYDSEFVPTEKFKQESTNSQIQRLERRIISLEEKQEDEDMNFFKSLIPHVKRLPTVNKLRFRIKVEELLANEITMLKENTSQENITSSLWVGY